MTTHTRFLWSPTLVLYHANCLDGFAAAWACHRKWPKATYLPVSYGKAPPNVAEHNVLLVDFSYSFDTLTATAWNATSTVVLDHHETAEAELNRLPMMASPTVDAARQMHYKCWEENTSDIAVYFDRNRSGATLAWLFANSEDDPHGLRPVNQFIAMVEDRDLWRFQLPYTKDVTASMAAGPYTFEFWDASYSDDGYYNIMREKSRGEAVNQHIGKLIRDALDTQHRLNVNGTQIPGVNCIPQIASEVCAALLVKNPEAPFVATWFVVSDGLVQVSLRSTNERKNVGSEAKMYGGGGHRNAAGFILPAANFAANVLITGE